AQHKFFSVAARVTDRDFRRGLILRSERKTPTSHAAQEMQSRCGQPHLHVHLLWIIPRQARAALQYDDVLSVRGPLWIDDVKRHVAMLDRSPLFEAQRFIARLKKWGTIKHRNVPFDIVN